MIYTVCQKCNVVNSKYIFRGSYEIDNKHYVKLEFKCSCGEILIKHITKAEYNKDII